MHENIYINNDKWVSLEAQNIVNSNYGDITVFSVTEVLGCMCRPDVKEAKSYLTVKYRRPEGGCAVDIYFTHLNGEDFYHFYRKDRVLINEKLLKLPYERAYGLTPWWWPDEIDLEEADDDGTYSDADEEEAGCV